MATKETKPVKQLRQLLDEQQEPFILNIYLLERACSRKSSNSESSFSCRHGNSRKTLERSINHGLHTLKKGNPQGLKVLRAVLNQVISIKQRLRINYSNHREGKLDVSDKGKNTQQKVNLFTTNSTQLLNLHNPIENEATTDTKLQQQSIEESRQLSPASVIEGIPSHGSFPIHSNNNECASTTEEESPSKTRVNLPKKFTEDCIFPASLGKVIFYSRNEKPACAEETEIQELVQSCVSPKFLKSKMVLQQKKQLLLDYVKDIVETQGREGKQQCHHKQFLGSEELGKIIGEKLKPWYKQSGNESNLTELLNLDLLNSEQECSMYKADRRDHGLEIEETVLGLLDSEQDWNEYEPQMREIGSEIGDAILEELVNDAVNNMIDFSSPITRC